MLNSWPCHEETRRQKRVLLALSQPAGADTSHDRYEFHIEAATLGQALEQLVEETGLQLLYPHDLAGTTGLNPVIGTYTIQQALDQLQAGTDLSSGLTTSEVIVISRKTGGQPQGREEEPMGVNKRTLLGAAAALLFGGQNGALAQTAPDGGEGGQEEASRLSLATVTVTAQKRSESANDVGMSINAYSGETMDDLGIDDVDDLVRIVPGFNYTKSSYGAPVYTIRGIGFFDTTLGASPAVSIYEDEVGIPYPVMSTGVGLDLERVEVLKGP